MGSVLESTIAVLNGAVGDYLARTGNGLATTMDFIHAGAPLRVERDVLARALAVPGPSPRVVILAHGVMCSEQVWEFADGTPDYGAALARDFGYTPLYLRYNSGLPIADNGGALDALLEKLVAEYPVPIEEILLLGYSMGGLVVRSACHVASLAGHRWLPLVRRAMYVATPHQGAPLERAGRVLTRLLAQIPDPYTRLIAEIGDLRSHGIKDLGDARLALDDAAHPVPLLPQIRHYLVAGTISDAPLVAALFGDALVPVPSGTNGLYANGALPPSHVKLLPRVMHLALAHHSEVYAQLHAWCREEAS